MTMPGQSATRETFTGLPRHCPSTVPASWHLRLPLAAISLDPHDRRYRIRQASTPAGPTD